MSSMSEHDPASVRAQPEPDEVKLGHAFRVGAEGDQAVSLMVTLLERQDEHCRSGASGTGGWDWPRCSPAEFSPSSFTDP